MTPDHSLPGRHHVIAIAFLVYVGSAHAIDTFSRLHVTWLFPWRTFYWQLENGFEISTFILWLVIPFFLVSRRIDWHYFTFRRWQRIDYAYLAVCILVGALSVLLILLVPSLGEQYVPHGDASVQQKIEFSQRMMVWNLSWLVGWEFMHRYALLTLVQKAWPRFGWLWVPIVEFSYHLQKPFIEAAGILLFSIIMTQWAIRRENILLPFIVHLSIELSLLLFLVSG